MKIGFYGGLANNTYVAAKSFHRQGIDVVYIRDIVDTFPFSQPVWEDVSFTLSYEDISNCHFTRQKWTEIEEKLGWQLPEYMLDPSKIDGKLTEYYQNNLILNFWYLRKSEYRKKIILAMQSVDCLIVCGIEATILAWASGRPYIIWPHGGDIRFASDFDQKWTSTLNNIKKELQRYVLKEAYKKCLWIGSHDPTGIGGHVTPINYSIEYFPLPLKGKKRLPKKERSNKLKQCLEKLQINVSENSYCVFIPSRIDYYWKGTDRLLAAIEHIQPNNIHFLFSGWGKDYYKAKNRMKEYSCCTFMPCAISKPILYELFSSVDLVIDQFCLGTYGTSALEAISVGTPVMMFIKNEAFAHKEWLPPPVLNVKSADEITKFLIKIDTGCLDFDFYSSEITRWFNKTHNETIAVSKVFSKIEDSLAAL
ncbi:hypothetical protein L3556_03380 [Candidatus Synechococcus calcipolaris G9]|uniref:Glycosyl transferase family 1 domain-containing protein n=1 Tax=Candidatus Synechococcus calcipolaris G9 TaxID=1497997 RepID=A0ABT6EW18_9SYNE|nr:glycosyltransferase [Candidatus Synechococcus calcipolaris]MDG2989979.1 hypothetical protein [Candidatus Synechococcus calcipolaris G9]